MSIVATWKHGFGLYHADAQIVAEEILSIGDEVRPEQIVEKARDKSTELHKCFEWDDTVAAEKYRLAQAGDIVRKLVIKRSNEEIREGKPEIRVFHRVDVMSGYKPIEKIIRNTDEYQSMLRLAFAELHALKVKYQNLHELDYILSLIP